MTIEEALVAKLAAVLGDVEVYPDSQPQTAADEDKPAAAVLYQHAGDDDLVLIDGSGRSATRIDLYAIEVWGADRAAIEAARDALYDAFAGANCQGYWGGGAGVGVWVQGAVASDASADAVPPPHGDEDPDRTERLTLRIVWTKE